jgi:hypothetical protein
LALTPGLNRDSLSASDESYYSTTKDWLEGPQMCTYKGSFHLAWSIPLPRPNYFLGGLGLHSFLMFAPILAIGGLREADGVLMLLCTGPVLGHYITDNLHESASIWCFFSTLQCALGAGSALVQLRQHRLKTASKQA